MREFVHSSGASSYEDDNIRLMGGKVHKSWLPHGSRWPHDFECHQLYDIKGIIRDKLYKDDECDDEDCCG
jgi:hypothetical protein